MPVRVPGLGLPRQASPRLKGHGIPCSCTDCGFGHMKEGWTAQKTPGHTVPPVLRTQLPTASLCLTLLRLSWRQQGNSCLVVKDSCFHWVPCVGTRSALTSLWLVVLSLSCLPLLWFSISIFIAHCLDFLCLPFQQLSLNPFLFNFLHFPVFLQCPLFLFRSVFPGELSSFVFTSHIILSFSSISFLSSVNPLLFKRFIGV